MYTPFDLAGRGAVVTGGIGYGMARALLVAGASVAVWGSNADKTGKARFELAAECGDDSRVHPFVCDVGDGERGKPGAEAFTVNFAYCVAS